MNEADIIAGAGGIAFLLAMLYILFRMKSERSDPAVATKRAAERKAAENAQKRQEDARLKYESAAKKAKLAEEKIVKRAKEQERRGKKQQSETRQESDLENPEQRRRQQSERNESASEVEPEQVAGEEISQEQTMRAAAKLSATLVSMREEFDARVQKVVNNITNSSGTQYYAQARESGAQLAEFLNTIQPTEPMFKKWFEAFRASFYQQVEYLNSLSIGPERALAEEKSQENAVRGAAKLSATLVSMREKFDAQVQQVVNNISNSSGTQYYAQARETGTQLYEFLNTIRPTEPMFEKWFEAFRTSFYGRVEYLKSLYASKMSLSECRDKLITLFARYSTIHQSAEDPAARQALFDEIRPEVLILLEYINNLPGPQRQELLRMLGQKKSEVAAMIRDFKRNIVVSE